MCLCTNFTIGHHSTPKIAIPCLTGCFHLNMADLARLCGSISMEMNGQWRSPLVKSHMGRQSYDVA